MSKVVTKEEAIKRIKDNDRVGITGFVASVHPGTLVGRIGESFLSAGSPRNLTVYTSPGVSGLNVLAHEGLIGKAVASHYGLAPDLAPLINGNKFEAYCLPQGTIAQLFRTRAAGQPGLLSKVGLGTFIDPRLDGGRMNEAAKDSIVELMNIDGSEYIFYKSFDVDVAILRGTTADTKGNISMEKEMFFLDCCALAMAAKASGGIVMVEVERVVQAGTIDPRIIKVPHFLVDYVVVGDSDKLQMSANIKYNPAISGEIKIPMEAIPPLPMNERKVMARRAAMELVPGSIINLGIGVPDGISSVMAEEGISDMITVTIEAGVTGGTGVGGGDFGGAYNPEAIIDMPSQFDFYDGGNLDLTCLGMAEIDSGGNVNVGKFGTKVVGPGGFINISQNAKTAVFCGTLTAGGLRVGTGDGSLSILAEGKSKKFKKKVQQITFSGEYAGRSGQKVLYVTERAVFRLTDRGVELVEIAPGVDLQKGVLDQIEGNVSVSPQLKLMDERIFRNEPMGLNKIICTKEVR